ncbi:IclR family transcriptional regulator [Phenylobacterium sp.]|uniref:IclR family transcriptional regulator n=1 Tax=Phenylobacterium sp. TaxID=1871053 RepID=UPI002FE1354A
MTAEAPARRTRRTADPAAPPARPAARSRAGENGRAEPESETAGLVGSVVQALAILRYIARTREPAGVTAIARAIGISPSSCFNILRTLVAEGFVERDDETKTYLLGVAPLDLARSVIDENGAFTYLRADMQRLADTFSVTTTLWRMTRSERWVLVGLTESLALARIHMTIGQRLPLYGGAMGRCLAAHRQSSQSELLSRFRSVRWFRAPSVEEYLAQVEETRVRGWGLDQNQFNQFFSSIAAPVIDNDNRIRFCVTQTMFDGQHSPVEIQDLGEATLRVADHASRNLYGRTRSARPLGSGDG